MKNNKKGITLIALVITIIVLLILAGISISMLTGDNSILNQSEKAKEYMELAENDEKIKLQSYEEIEKYQNTTENESSIELFGLQGNVFIGQKSYGKRSGDITQLDNTQTSNPTEDGNGYTFAQGHYIYAENLEYLDYETGNTNTQNVYLCWDEGEITTLNQRFNTPGYYDLFTPDGKWVGTQGGTPD